MVLDQLETNIKLTQNSRLSNIDWNNLSFGKIFSDHMFNMVYQNGEWSEKEIVSFDQLSLSPATSALHYGQSCFEGMKAHRKENGEVVLFRPYDNAKRFNISSERMCMPTIPEDVFVNSIKELLSIDKDWVPTNPTQSLYIRPFIFATDSFLGVRPSDNYRFMVFTCPVGAYYNEPVPVKIETRYTRAASGGTGYAKAAGNYAAAMYPAKLGQNQGYKQLIWTDSVEHKYIEEAGTMNVLFVINGTLVTPSPEETILDGITRRSVVDIANDWGMPVEVRRVAVTEVVEALENGTLTEAFGAGTAATVAPISSICYNDINYNIEPSNPSHFHVKVMDYLNQYKRGLVEDKYNWLITV